MCSHESDQGDRPCPDKVGEFNSEGEPKSELEERNVSLILSEHEAFMANCPEISVEHVILGVSQHAKWRGVFQEIGLDHDRLRQLLTGEGGRRLPVLPMTADLRAVLARAQEFCGLAAGVDVPPCGLHLLEAIVESQCPAARIILRESQRPVEEVIAKWRSQCPYHQAKGKTWARWSWKRKAGLGYFALVVASFLVYLGGVALTIWLKDDYRASAERLGLIVFFAAATIFWSAPGLILICSVVYLVRAALKRKKR